MLFGVRFCNVLYGLIWLSYGLNQIWFDDSLLKVICPQDFESGLLQDVVSMFFFGICRSCFWPRKSSKVWFVLWQWDRLRRLIPSRLKWSPCVVRLRSCAMQYCVWLQSASDCFKLFLLLLFKLFQTASKCFKLLQNASKNVQKGTILRGPGHAAASCPRWPLGIRFQGDAQGECSTVVLHVGAWCD